MAFFNRVRKRLRFSLRALLGLTAVVAVFFSIGSSVGYIEATGALVAILLLTYSTKAAGDGRTASAARVLGIAVLWMTAVDVSWFREECQDCHLDLDMLHFRVYGVSMARIQHAEYGIVICRIAQDLGNPCPHRFERWHMTRYWGMFLPARPHFTGIVRLVGDEPPSWYDEETTRILRRRVRASPELAEEFYARVIISHDRDYLRRFIRGLIEERTGKPYPSEAP
jgi:hypothetical protein